jgi:hypothetical protein
VRPPDDSDADDACIATVPIALGREAAGWAHTFLQVPLFAVPIPPLEVAIEDR